VQISRRSRQKFADLAASLGTIRKIEDAYAAEDFLLASRLRLPESVSGRSICAAPKTVSTSATSPSISVSCVCISAALKDWGRLPSLHVNGDPLVAEARALIRSLQQDGAPVDDDGPPDPGRRTVAARFERLTVFRARVLMAHLNRINARSLRIRQRDWIVEGTVESVLKFVLETTACELRQEGRASDLIQAGGG